MGNTGGNLVHHYSPPEAKIALFRSLFRGRDDVCPLRFESRRTGKSGAGNMRLDDTAMIRWISIR
jgi:hypothetical protein